MAVFEHSDIRILNLFRISDFVLRICCSPRSKISLGHLVASSAMRGLKTDCFR